MSRSIRACNKVTIRYHVAPAAFAETVVEMRRSVQSIGLVPAFAFVVNYSGMSSSLALLLAGTGVAFPFFSPFLGWLGGVPDGFRHCVERPVLVAAKHHRTPSWCIRHADGRRQHDRWRDRQDDFAALDRGRLAATGLVGKEADLFRFTVKFSLLFVFVVGIITMVQAYVLTGMIPK